MTASQNSRTRGWMARLAKGLAILTPLQHWRKKHHRMLTALVIFVSHLAGALTSIRALLETRTSQGTIAWVVSLNTFPYLAVPAYWVFGRSKFEGYVSARRSSDERLVAQGREYVAKLRERDLLAQPDRDQALLVEKLAKLPFTRGNRAELLVNGDATFQSLFEGIDQARDYILVQFYILRDDLIGRELKDRLLARARAGVRVYVLYDEVGSGDLSQSWAQELHPAGVELKAFNTTQGSANRFQLNFRNHRKTVVVDGTTAWVGGHNVGDEYLGRDPKIGFWRDTHLKVDGPVVQSIQVAFAEDWYWAAQTKLSQLNWEPRAASGGHSTQILCLPTGPDDPLETCTLFNLRLINSARNRLWIASPYFVPDEQFISALQLAALRGVDVRVLVPDKSDNKMVELSGWSYFAELDRVGIRFYRHQKGFMHQKVMLVDDAVCTIGTANFDNRSFRLNFEITLGVLDREFVGQVATMLEQDLADSRLVSSSEVDAQGFWKRLVIRICRLMAPLQ